jgi:hypothetical protein
LHAGRAKEAPETPLDIATRNCRLLLAFNFVLYAPLYWP